MPFQINEIGLANFVDKLDLLDWEQTMRLCSDPTPDLPFETVEAEVNFYSSVGLTNFGSGFRLELMAANGRGASDSIVHGTKALHVFAQGNLSAKFLTSLNVDTVARLYLMADGPLLPLATNIHSVLSSAGSVLLARGHTTFFDFIKTQLSFVPKKGQEAEWLVSGLVSAFPSMQDYTMHLGHQVYILKKPQLLAIDLYRRLHKRLPELFTWGDIMHLTVFADNVLPVVLRHFGILLFDHQLAAITERKEVLPPDEREVEIRALSVHACVLLLEKLNARLTASGMPVVDSTQLDFFLWFKGRDWTKGWPERHYTKDTIFY